MIVFALWSLISIVALVIWPVTRLVRGRQSVALRPLPQGSLMDRIKPASRTDGKSISDMHVAGTGQNERSSA